MSEPRTFVVKNPPMEGEDIKNWQREIKDEFATMNILCPIVPNGVYDAVTRSFAASLCNALGMNASTVMRAGVTPKLRTRIRNRDLTKSEKTAFEARVQWRRDLRERYDHYNRALILVHRPVVHIIEASWGFHKGVHDGLDVIALPNAVVFAMVKSKVIDVRSSGWWGKGAPANQALKSKGDGIVQLEVLETVGPFIKGHHIGYGHCEHARVRKGQVVEAGHPIARCGLANAWHIHLMYNDGKTDKGVGNIDPRKILDYTLKHG